MFQQRYRQFHLRLFQHIYPAQCQLMFLLRHLLLFPQRFRQKFQHSHLLHYQLECLQFILPLYRLPWQQIHRPIFQVPCLYISQPTFQLTFQLTFQPSHLQYSNKCSNNNANFFSFKISHNCSNSNSNFAFTDQYCHRSSKPKSNICPKLSSNICSN